MTECRSWGIVKQPIRGYFHSHLRRRQVLTAHILAEYATTSASWMRLASGEQLLRVHCVSAKIDLAEGIPWRGSTGDSRRHHVQYARCGYPRGRAVPLKTRLGRAILGRQDPESSRYLVGEACRVRASANVHPATQRRKVSGEASVGARRHEMRAGIAASQPAALPLWSVDRPGNEARAEGGLAQSCRGRCMCARGVNASGRPAS